MGRTDQSFFVLKKFFMQIASCKEYDESLECGNNCIGISNGQVTSRVGRTATYFLASVVSGSHQNDNQSTECRDKQRQRDLQSAGNEISSAFLPAPNLSAKWTNFVLPATVRFPFHRPTNFKKMEICYVNG
jgi:hypothetical protein